VIAKSHSDIAAVTALARCRAVAPVTKALALEMRLRILDVLQERTSCTVGDLAQEIGADCSTASQHLAILRRVGLVRNEKKDQWVLCEVTPAGRRVLDCCERVANCVAARGMRDSAAILVIGEPK